MAAQDYTSVVQQLYVSYFGRPADYYGLQSFAAALDAMKAPKTFAEVNAAVQKDTAGTSALSKLVNSFNTSKESTDLYGTDNSEIGIGKFVNAIYQNVLGRDADLKGFGFWVENIKNGTLTKANAAASITQAALVDPSEQGKLDALTVQNKLAIATSFTTAIDTPAEITSYAGDAAAAAARSLLKSVNNTTNVTAYQANVAEALAAISNQAVAGSTFALTKGLDTLTGTSANDTFVGSIDSGENNNVELNTLSSIDLINGGAGVDTLKVAHASGDITLGSLSNVEVVEIESAAKGGVEVNTSAVAGVTNLNVTKAAGAVAATASATTNVGVSLKDSADIKTITVAGGNNVNVAVTDAVSAIEVGVGEDADAVGAVVISATGAASVVGKSVVMGTITVDGGTTVNVTQKATANSAALVADANVEKVTQGNVVITASATTTAVTVKQDAAIGAQSRAAVTGVAEVASVKFTALKAKESVTVGGLTFTAAKDLTAAQVAQAFANLSASAIKPGQIDPESTAAGDTNGSSAVANGTFSGSLASFVLVKDKAEAGGTWSSGAANGDTVIFTGKAGTSQVNLTGSDKVDIVTTTDGVDAVTAQNRLGVDAGTVTITGAAALKTVTIDGYAASTGEEGINGGANAALSTITLANGGSFAIDSAAATLALNLTNVDGTVSVAAGTKTINASVTGDDATAILVSASAEAVNVAGTGNVEGTTAKGGLDVATSINTSAMTAGTAVFTIANGTTTSYTGGAAADIVTISNANTKITKAVTLGAGDDTLILNTTTGNVDVPTATLSGGEGTDTIGLSGASAAALSANTSFAGKIEGFEKLEITDKVGAVATVNMANMDGITYVVSNNASASATVTGRAQVFSFNIAGLELDNTGTLSAGGQVLFTAEANDVPAADIAAAINAKTVIINDVSYEVSAEGTAITLTSTANVAPQPAINVSAEPKGGTAITNAGVTTTAGAADVVGGTSFLTLDKMVNDSTLELVGAGDGVVVKMADATGSDDSFNIVTTVVGESLTFGTVDVAGVETINLNAVDAQPIVARVASIQTGTLVLNADSATSLTIAGNSNLELSLGDDTDSLATINASAMTGKLEFAANGTVAVTVTGGSAADTLSASVGADAKADVINGGAGNDVIYAGSNGAKLTGGAGNDLFIVSAASVEGGNKEANTYSEITDFSAGDVLQLQAFVDGAVADVSAFSKLAATLQGTARFSDFANAAIKEATEGAAVWFNYEGDTYVVVDSGVDTAAFVNGEDLIVKLTGINGDNLSWNGEFGTAALI